VWKRVKVDMCTVTALLLGDLPQSQRAGVPIRFRMGHSFSDRQRGSGVSLHKILVIESASVQNNSLREARFLEKSRKAGRGSESTYIPHIAIYGSSWRRKGAERHTKLICELNSRPTCLSVPRYRRLTRMLETMALLSRCGSRR
jgi:hypothetical protein